MMVVFEMKVALLRALPNAQTRLEVFTPSAVRASKSRNVEEGRKCPGVQVFECLGSSKIVESVQVSRSRNVEDCPGS